MKNLVVFASGSGSNFQSIIDAISSGSLSANISGLITNKDFIRAIDRARKVDIPVSVLNPSEFESTEEYENRLLEILQENNADLLILAGYMKKIPSAVVNKYEDRILNIHPSLIPKHCGKGFYGLKVHESVLDSEDEETGCTVHIVNQEFDDGPILAQSKVSVQSDDTPETLAKRVLAEEHKLYPKVIQEYLKKLN